MAGIFTESINTPAIKDDWFQKSPSFVFQICLFVDDENIVYLIINEPRNLNYEVTGITKYTSITLGKDEYISKVEYLYKDRHFYYVKFGTNRERSIEAGNEHGEGTRGILTNIRLLDIRYEAENKDENESENEDENESGDEDENESEIEDENESKNEDENESENEDENESENKDENESENKDENKSENKDENESENKDENESENKDENESENKDGNESDDLGENLSLRYIRDYQPSVRVAENQSFVLAYAPPLAELEECSTPSEKLIDMYQDIVAHMINRTYSVSVEVELILKIATSLGMGLDDLRKCTPFKDNYSPVYRLATLGKKLGEHAEDISYRRVTSIPQGYVGVKLVSGDIMKGPDGMFWMFPTSVISYSLIKFSDAGVLLGHYDLTGALYTQLPELKKNKKIENGYVYYDESAEINAIAKELKDFTVIDM